tara:strand:- start:225 stop:392 length:168 start_codon:yes stop_codon:yes gene_type:complete
MSKGSRQRPVNKEKFDNNFDKIFGKNKTVTVSVTVTGAQGAVTTDNVLTVTPKNP